ncbi:Fis family transcriptional regulator [Cryobacterium sp. TMT1-21]|uniref:HNH endonuclease n=1 Tax=Cryobacterium sp. TMT1-21 TaxID=1259234 RepID=UPI00106C0EA3|nr:HNH endonuclease [Cryobacterium sp. TMT1-21]TFD15492.1 Fis family transcriptional regulator [Cryobacterium sp. TMT1-21]
MKLIALSGKQGSGKYAIVDDDDFDELNQYMWHVAAGYAYRKPSSGGIAMHQTLLHCPQGSHIDHKNGQPLDNRRSNLRVVTPSHNGANRNRLNINNRTGYMGVYKTPNRPTWSAKVQVMGRNFDAGRYRDPEEAAWMYDQWKLALQGEFATLNFQYV